MDMKFKMINHKITLLAITGLMAYSQSGFSATQLTCSGATCQASVNYFVALGEYFENGSRPTPEESKGWFSGRCYESFSGSQAVGGLLVIESIVAGLEPGGTHGPLFPISGEPTNFTVGIFGPTNDPGFYDHLSAATEDEISDHLKTPEYQNLRAALVKGSLASEGSGNLRFEIRKYQHYYISQNIVIQSRGFYKAGDIYMRCYFFKKIK